MNADSDISGSVVNPRARTAAHAVLTQARRTLDLRRPVALVLLGTTDFGAVARKPGL